MTHITLIWLRLVFWFVFVGLIRRGSAQQIDQSPRLEDLIEFLNVDPSDFDAISQAVVAFPVRFTVDVSDRRALSTMLQRGGADLTRGCALVIPTYFIHVTDAAIAIAFRATSRDNVTTFSIKPGSLPLSPQSADPLPPLRDPATGKKFKRMWMHVEKTGGSFATTAEMLGYQWIAHTPPRSVVAKQQERSAGSSRSFESQHSARRRGFITQSILSIAFTVQTMITANSCRVSSNT